jgi:hypothetical protein
MLWDGKLNRLVGPMGGTLRRSTQGGCTTLILSYLYLSVGHSTLKSFTTGLGSSDAGHWAQPPKCTRSAQPATHHLDAVVM